MAAGPAGGGKQDDANDTEGDGGDAALVAEIVDSCREQFADLAERNFSDATDKEIFTAYSDAHECLAQAQLVGFQRGGGWVADAAANLCARRTDLRMRTTQEPALSDSAKFARLERCVGDLELLAADLSLIYRYRDDPGMDLDPGDCSSSACLIERLGDSLAEEHPTLSHEVTAVMDEIPDVASAVSAMCEATVEDDHEEPDCRLRGLAGVVYIMTDF